MVKDNQCHKKSLIQCNSSSGISAIIATILPRNSTVKHEYIVANSN